MSQSHPLEQTRVIRRAHFSAARQGSRLDEVHGHNYVLEAHVQGPIDPLSGMVLGIAELKELLAVTTAQLDHRLLSRDVAAFRSAPATAENVARFCYEDLARQLAARNHLQLYKVRLFESEDLWVDYAPVKPL